MSAKPLTRDERDLIALNVERAAYSFPERMVYARYEATVQQAERRAEIAERRLDALRLRMEGHRECCPPWIGEALDADDDLNARLLGQSS